MLRSNIVGYPPHVLIVFAKDDRAKITPGWTGNTPGLSDAGLPERLSALIRLTIAGAVEVTAAA